MLSQAAGLFNSALSFLVFSFLDLLDAILCLVYKLLDYAVEANCKPCYCFSDKKDVIARGDLEDVDVSDTLYSRSSSSRVAAFGRKVAMAVSANCNFSEVLKGIKTSRRRGLPRQVPLWSDCDCKTCSSWCLPSSSSPESHLLHVRVEGPEDTTETTTDVIFIHGFISSSKFWTETVFREFTDDTRSSHRLFAVDLLGFGRSPKPADSLYTLREQVDMIRKSVLERHHVRSFHIVAHSMGCFVALALAVEHPDAVKSLTLLAPPYFPVPKGEKAAEFVMRRVAPRKVWPPMVLGASVACWYEHISRTICLLICKNHRLWEFLFRLVTANRMRTFLIEGFMCHTHRAAWHSLHNVVCGSAARMETCMDAVSRLSCEVAVFHGEDDVVVPVDCSYAVGSKIPRAGVKVFEKKDHVTIVVGQQKALARELEQIWRKPRSTDVSIKEQVAEKEKPIRRQTNA